jgi:flagellar motor switch protein FliN/FliY
MANAEGPLMTNVQATANWLVARWTSHFSEITLTMGDVQAEMHASQMDDAAMPADGMLWWQQSFSCAPESPLWIGAAEETWNEIGRIVLSAAGVCPAPASEMQSTYLEIIRQSTASMASDIGERTSTQVTTVEGVVAAPRKLRRQMFEIQAKLPERTVAFYVLIADDLCHVVSSRAARNTAVVPDEAHMAKQEPALELSPLPASRTFELLLDVELPVCVSFGRAVLKLQDALKLITGALIELDRGLSDPVDLLVNNCVIARGEVVVVEGNYGVRITEIVSQKERLQQSRRYMLQ